MRSNFPEQTAAVMGGGEKKGPIKEQLDYLDYFDDDHDEDEDDEEIAPLDAMESARKKKMSLYCPTGKGSEVGTGGRRRVSVSAAVINADSVAKQKVLIMKQLEGLPAKTHEVQQKLIKFVKNLTMFGNLGDTGTDTIVRAMSLKNFSSGTEIIHQGDAVADNFYILDSGSATVHKDGEQVHEYHAGDGFGELALMYNAKRAATVKASTDCTAWALDQHTFKVVVMSAAVEHRKQVEKFLSNVPLLSSLSDMERHNMAEGMSSYKYGTGDLIIREGDTGNMFYVIKSGNVECIKGGEKVAELSDGAYFGEIALLTDQLRQATVKSTSATEVLGLDRAAFQRVLGPLGDVLKRNIQHYNQVMHGHAF